MQLIIGLLTLFLVLNCLFLILLILIQLPKKEAGAGLAFGGGATDALFGAGSGNVLTKVTKYLTAAFLLLALVLSVLGSSRSAARRPGLADKLGGMSMPVPAVAPAVPTNLATPQLQTLVSNISGLKPLAEPATAVVPANAPVPPAGTNPPAAPGR